MGDEIRGVYQAMCSLFLQPTSALLYNAYNEKDRPWSEYAMGTAQTRLSTILKSSLRNGERAALPGWHEAFDPVNPFGLLLINTHGSPTIFHLDAGPGQTADIPESSPTTLHMIHSFSAESPNDPRTIGGRWLANGAFIYFGAMSEPYLDAFRTPGVVATFLAENLPVVAAVRQIPGEVRGGPWRLAFFGDPLYRVRPPSWLKGRLTTAEAVSSWPAYVEFRQPGPQESENLRLKWVLRTGIYLAQGSATPQQQIDLPAVLLSIARDHLDKELQPLFDDLLVAVLLPAKRSNELIDRLTRIPPSQRSPSVERHLETAQMAALQRAAAAGKLRQAIALTGDVVQAEGSDKFVETFLTRVGRLAGDDPVRLSEWRDRLVSILRGDPAAANVPAIKEELKRVTDKVGTVRGR